MPTVASLHASPAMTMHSTQTVAVPVAPSDVLERADTVVTDLLRPDAYPSPTPAAVELRETHVSWVFLTEGEVFKIKKPVRFSFLDFSTLKARREACEAEVLLNGRLAAGTYLGLVPVRRDSSGRLHFGAHGEVVDWAVHMLRLPDAFRADVRLSQAASGSSGAAPHALSSSGLFVDAVAELVANFHARARCDEATSRWGRPEIIELGVRENFADVDPAQLGLLTVAQAREVERAQLEFLRSNQALFEQRRATFKVREGHGDLRLDHIYVGDDGELTILDCIEFGERFRCADVCADVAFLSMDLVAHRRADLAERFLARYARATNDFEIYDLIDFYEGYRAYVRAKISTLTAAQSTGPRAEQALADARRHFAVALSTGRRSMLAPVVVAVGGVIASGKSTVAELLSDALSAPVIDADRTRKHLIGLPPLAHDASAAFEGPYDPKVTEQVYAEMMQRGATVLRSGRPVILDASFRNAELRRRARDLAAAHGVPFMFVECRASAEACRTRLAQRETETHVSDGRLAIFDAFCGRADAAEELSQQQRIVIDTERPLDQVRAVLEERLCAWPRGLTG